ADAELNAVLGRDIGIAIEHAALNVDGASDSVDDADKFHQDAIACCFDDAAAMLSNLGIDQLLAVLLELVQRAFLVGTHQPAVAGNVADENSRKPAVNVLFTHSSPHRLLGRATNLVILFTFRPRLY